jgi:hypothetical protein
VTHPSSAARGVWRSEIIMKTLIGLAAGLFLLAAPAAAAPMANVGGGEAVAASATLPVETVQSRGKRVAPVGGPYRGGPPHRGGWHGGGRHHNNYYRGGRWYGGGWGRGWGYGGWGGVGYWPGYYGGYYGYGAPVIVGAPVVVGPRAVVVAPRGVAVAPRGVVKVRRPWTKAWYRSCAQRYRSFNARTGYYRTYSGRLVFCR